MPRVRTQARVLAASSALQRTCLAMSASVALLSGVCALYLLKSWLGINLMAGHSPLHDLLYPLVRGS